MPLELMASQGLPEELWAAAVAEVQAEVFPLTPQRL
jgi:hypothetical protein